MDRDIREVLDQFAQYAGRRSGIGASRRMSVGQLEMLSRYAHRLHTLPAARPILIVNTDGTPNYLPGMDGPVDPSAID